MGSEDKPVLGTKAFKTEVKKCKLSLPPSLEALLLSELVINLAQRDAAMSLLLPVPARISYLYQLSFDNSSQRFEMPDRNLKDTFASLQRGLLFKEDLDSQGCQKHIESRPPHISHLFSPVCIPHKGT